MPVRRQLEALALLLAVVVTAGCLGALSPDAGTASDGGDLEAGAVPLELPPPEPGTVPLVETDGPYYGSAQVGNDGFVLQLDRKPTLIPEGTEALHVWANHSNPVRDADLGYKRADEDGITWVETEDGERAVVEVEPGETEAEGPAWEFYARVQTADGTSPVGVYEAAALDAGLHVAIQAVGSYPAWDRGEPLQAETWDEYRRAAGAGVPADHPEEPEVGSPSEAPVVAVVDTGINPYHEAFRAPGGGAPVDGVDATDGEPAVRFPTEPADIRERWPTVALENGTLYRFTGTRTYFYSTLDEVPAFDTTGHGTATAGTVVAQEPDATIVSVQVDAHTLADGIRWAAKQPWIDVLSVSWGCPANCIPFYPAHQAGVDVAGFEEMTEATHLAWDNGKVVVFSAGNDPTPSLTDPSDSPPWVVSVGGADPERKGETWIASKTPDLVADFVVDAPAHDSRNGTVTVPGTSFAAPTVSGTLAGALHDLRQAAGGTNGVDGGALVDADGATVTNRDLREALNRTAIYWDAADYEPEVGEPGNNPRTLFPGVPINPAAPWLQMGWGYVNGTLSDEIAQGLLQGDLPEKPPDARAYMESRQAALEKAWG